MEPRFHTSFVASIGLRRPPVAHLLAWPRYARPSLRPCSGALPYFEKVSKAGIVLTIPLHSSRRYRSE